jgi:hypothetical protein
VVVALRGETSALVDAFVSVSTVFGTVKSWLASFVQAPRRVLQLAAQVACPRQQVVVPQRVAVDNPARDCMRQRTWMPLRFVSYRDRRPMLFRTVVPGPRLSARETGSAEYCAERLASARQGEAVADARTPQRLALREWGRKMTAVRHAIFLAIGTRSHMLVAGKILRKTAAGPDGAQSSCKIHVLWTPAPCGAVTARG